VEADEQDLVNGLQIIPHLDDRNAYIQAYVFTCRKMG
jgi:hypothetical protein